MGSGSRNLCRSCSRIPSAGGANLATTVVEGPGTSRTSVRDQALQAQRFQAFQRAAAARQRVAARARMSETAGFSVSSRLRELQFRELTPEDYEVLQQLDEIHRQQRAEEGVSSSGSVSNDRWNRSGSVSGLFDLDGPNLAAANRLQSRRSSQWRRVLRPDALLPAPESGGWKGEDCAICLDCLKDSETVCALPRCGHTFHRTCIEGWLTQGKPACPLDNMEVDL